MTKEDFITLIKIYDNLFEINNHLRTITGGYGLMDNEKNAVILITDVIYNNSKFAGRTDDEAADEFIRILRFNTSPEEREEMLKGVD